MQHGLADAAFRVVLDGTGRVWVSGTTQSEDFPLKNSDRSYFGRGAINAFVARINAEGTLEYIAMIGDATSEGLVIAPGGNVYVSGTKAPSQEKHYAYVAEIQENGEARILTLGPGTASGITLDGRGALFAVGFTGRGAFIARVELGSWRQTAFRLIGNADGDRARAVALDRAGRPQILGTITSRDFPGTQPLAGTADVFLAAFDATLGKRRYATVFGGSCEDIAGFNGASMKLDSRGNLWIAGLTRSDNLHARGRYVGADDGFIASFAPSGRRPRFATYFGGPGLDMLEGLAIAPDGTVWATGLTSSRGLSTPDYRGGRSDAVLVRLTTVTR
jgi:hypothetical protein